MRAKEFTIITENKSSKEKEAEFRLNHAIDRHENDTAEYGMADMAAERAGRLKQIAKRKQREKDQKASKEVSEAKTFNSKQEMIAHFVDTGRTAAQGAAAWERMSTTPKKKKPNPFDKDYKFKPVDNSRYGEKDESMDEGFVEEFCPDCGGSLAEAGKASRSLCLSSKPNNELGASQLSSCKSQGLRSRESSKKHTIANKRVKIKGKRIKGHEYGGPLPYNKSDLTK